MATSSVSLKLFIDTKSQKVLFAEAERDFVDFLFNLLALPVATVTRLLTKDSMVGSLGNLYDSFETFSESFLVQSHKTKEALLRPKFFSGSCTRVPLLPDYASVSRKFYFGGNWQFRHYCVADDPKELCPDCGFKMSRVLTHVDHLKTGESISEEGFVKGIVGYMVMDDLAVKPISSFALLKSFDVEDIGDLEVKEVHLDMAQGVKLLKASLQSNTVPTNVFLRDSNSEAEKKLVE